MWTEAGVRLLIAAFPPDGCTIGLYTAGERQPEMTALRGTYRRLPLPAAPWVVTKHADGGWIVSGPEIGFTGFVARHPARGVLIFQGQTLLYASPFADGLPRVLLSEADRLDVTPAVILREIDP